MAQVSTPRVARRQVVIKPETTYGTDIFAGTYVAADVLKADAASIRLSPNLEEFLNRATAGQLGRVASTIGQRTGRISFEMWIRGAGAAYSASVLPEVDRPLRACGLAATLVVTGGAESVTYQPSDTHEAMSVYITQPIAGSSSVLSAQFVGVHGTPTFAGIAGGPGRVTFDLEGVLEEMADVTFAAGTLLTTPKYPILQSAAFQIGSNNYSPRIREFTFAMGNQLVRVPDISAANAGLVGFMIADREPSLVIDPETALDATSSWWAALQDGDPLQDCTFQLGTAQYNRLKFQFASGGSNAGIQVVAQDWVDRDGIAALRTTLRPTIANGANSDFALVFD